MERNHIIGFVLIFLTLMLWTMFSKPSDAEIARAKAKRDSIARLSQLDTFSQKSTAQVNKNISNTTTVVDSTAPKEASFILENDVIKLTFSNNGARIVGAQLKKHLRSDLKNNNQIIEYLNNPQNKFTLDGTTKSGSFSTEGKVFTGIKNGSSLVFTTQVAGGNLAYSYQLGQGYDLKFEIKHNLSLTQNPAITWHEILPKLERSDINEQRLSTVYYKDTEENTADYCSCTGDDNVKLSDKKIEWVSHSNQFFNTSLMTKNFKFAGGDFVSTMTNVKESNDLKILNSVVGLPKDMTSYQMEYYIGPNEFSTLKSFGNGLEQIIPFGASIFGTINRYVVRPSFDFLSNLISNKGIVIILLIFIIKMLLYPLLYKMLYGQAKMAALKPELDQLKLKHKDDLQKQQMESMKIYQEYGVNPLSGCMPMLLQMPIWIALYRFFPASITFRKESFLWADDLSTYDNIANLPFEIPMFGAHISLFTVLWAISTVVYTYYSTKNVDMSANPALKYVQYIMPVMFLGFFNSYASGLTAYMFFSNLINILQIIITKNFVFDNDKIRKELEIQKSQPKKKSGFQAKLQEALKQQQEQAAKRAKK
jgi:YidC/Oxa1 family membrane protein insertase